jgi:lipoprotein NlpI
MHRLAILLLFSSPLSAVPDRGDLIDDKVRQAQAVWKSGQRGKALELAEEIVTAAPKDPRGYFLRGTFREGLNKHDEAIADFSKCVELDPRHADAYNHRGSEQFKRGKIAESLADFDRFLKLKPQEFPGHWKRGITLYYLGRYDEGRKQFEGYEKVDTNDVENAVWHFLCVARKDGVEKARASILKIGRDARVPMMEVYALFQGKAKPADVLAAAEAGQVPPEKRHVQLFYAHLYLGLYAEVNGDTKKALEHLKLAAEKYPIGHYMGDVARVHRDLLEKK